MERIEKTARDRGIAPRKLIRAVFAEHFGGDGRPRLGGPIGESNQHSSLDQILFDVTRTRLTLQHLLDHQIGSEATDRSARLRNKKPNATCSGSGEERYESVTNRPQIRI